MTTSPERGAQHAYWDLDTIASRVQDGQGRNRYEGGSPNPADIAAYESALKPETGADTAVVLGMTPELRAMALRRFRNVVSIDANPTMIDFYRDWTAAEHRSRETIHRANWLNLERIVEAPVDAVFGDGVFANLPDWASHRTLLRAIRRALAPGGVLSTRTIVIPRDFDPRRRSAEWLVRRFRAGALNEAEFGFAMRFFGYYEKSYDPRTWIADNARAFDCCAEAHGRGELSDAEHAIILRYYYGGPLVIPPQDAWEKMLADSGFEFQILPCHDRDWCAYYMIYGCTPR